MKENHAWSVSYSWMSCSYIFLISLMRQDVIERDPCFVTIYLSIVKWLLLPFYGKTMGVIKVCKHR